MLFVSDAVHEGLVAAAIERLGRIDTVVYTAGMNLVSRSRRHLNRDQPTEMEKSP